MSADFNVDEDDCDGEFIMNREQSAWAKKLQKLLNTIPDGIELLVGHGVAHVHPEGWYQREIYDSGADMMRASDLIEDASAHTIPFPQYRIRPNSESV